MRYKYRGGFKKYQTKILNLSTALTLMASGIGGAALPLFAPQSAAALSSIATIYDALPSTSPDTNYPSQPFQAQQTDEFGDYVHLAGTARTLNTVTVTMSDWAKYSDYASDPVWGANSSYWTYPITLNVYSSHLGANGAPDNKLATVTQNVNVPWRPESDPTCGPTSNGNGWKESGSCYDYSGLAFNATFDLNSQNVTLPNDVIVGVTLNTQSYGSAPTGVAGPYNSLNVAVPANQPVTIGSDDSSDAVFWNTHTCSYYTDGGASGCGVLRKDTNWSPNGTVALQITATGGIPCDAASAGNFEDDALGSVNGQDGWKSTGGYDQAVVDNTYGYAAFGCKTLRISNAKTSGSFGDQTFSYKTQPAGESSTNATNNHYEATFDIASTSSAYQPGMSLSVSPDDGTGNRMSYLRFEDQIDGIHVFFDDVTTTTDPADWNDTDIATLDRTVPHTVKFAIDYNDGSSNDVVKVYIDGVLKTTGTTWENYYRYDSEQAGNGNKVPATDELLFRAGGSAAPANNGNGYLFDNVTVATSATSTSGGSSTGGGSSSGSSGGGTSSTSGSNPSTTSGTSSNSKTNSGGTSGNGSSTGSDNDNAAEVLGLSTETPGTSSNGQVSSESTFNPNSTPKNAKHNSNFLGLGWWWLLILAVVATFLGYANRRRQQN